MPKRSHGKDNNSWWKFEEYGKKKKKCKIGTTIYDAQITCSPPCLYINLITHTDH